MSHGRIARDPETGRFVSVDSDATIDRTERLHGAVSVSVPAADATGGDQTQVFDTEDSELIDFSDELDEDEVFHLQAAYVSVAAYASVTATAESTLVATYGISRDTMDAGPLLTRPSHTASAPSSAIDFEQGIIDGSVAQDDDDSLLLTGVLASEPSAADSTNGLGLGAAPANDSRSVLPWADMGQTWEFDDDDELKLLGELDFEGASDHGVSFVCYLDVHGFVEEVHL